MSRGGDVEEAGLVFLEEFSSGAISGAALSGRTMQDIAY
jgi:hypothetical protein